jgi:SlyX protein
LHRWNAGASRVGAVHEPLSKCGAFDFSPGYAGSAEDRFIKKENKVAHQENLVESLNQTIYEQGRRIDQLEAMVAKLADHVRTLRDAGQGPVNDRPPHY